MPQKEEPFLDVLRTRGILGRHAVAEVGRRVRRWRFGAGQILLVGVGVDHWVGEEDVRMKCTFGPGADAEGEFERRYPLRQILLSLFDPTLGDEAEGHHFSDPISVF